MTDAITIVPGTRIGAWEILSVGPIGKRACVGCPCGSTHVYSCEALLSGTAMCHAAPLTPAQRELSRDEAQADARRRRFKNWRPSGDRT
jgi:hypothetical protein